MPNLPSYLHTFLDLHELDSGLFAGLQGGNRIGISWEIGTWYPPHTPYIKHIVLLSLTLCMLRRQIGELCAIVSFSLIQSTRGWRSANPRLLIFSSLLMVELLLLLLLQWWNRSIARTIINRGLGLIPLLRQRWLLRRWRLRLSNVLILIHWLLICNLFWLPVLLLREHTKLETSKTKEPKNQKRGEQVIKRNAYLWCCYCHFYPLLRKILLRGMCHLLR